MESAQRNASNYFQLCNKLLQNNLLFIKLPYFDYSLHFFILYINGPSSSHRHRRNEDGKKKQDREERNIFIAIAVTHL